jgi:hypothetical protein
VTVGVDSDLFACLRHIRGRIDRFAFKGENAKHALMHPAKWLLADETFQPVTRLENALLSDKGIGDPHASNLLPILKVFTVKNVTLTFDRRSDNQRIVPR